MLSWVASAGFKEFCPVFKVKLILKYFFTEMLDYEIDKLVLFFFVSGMWGGRRLAVDAQVNTSLSC